ncbi:MAG TPA: response regulator [Candidatus Angelobacter sp.]|nr:response regulator [Candidatus Angelobacter sp.]
MSLRILFADDSMTAQNMGKKILSDAGYDVVAVSNGAAAVKKIAEQKPDIIILDVYMPGYSGLEVCEKVRGSLDTMKIPVLLTVGKMEPYKPEDANRVKADGVIIKPFEASDLLAIMKKFEERVGKMAIPPIVAQTVPAESRQEEEKAAAHEAIDHSPKSGMQPMVEVPDHMAGAAAFNDMLGADSSIAPQHFGVSSPSAAFETSVIVPAPPIPTAEYELPVSWKQEEKPEPVAAAPAHIEHEIAATPVHVAPEPVVNKEPETVAMEPLADPQVFPMAAEASAPTANDDAGAHSHPQFIPVYKEPESASSYEVMPTAAPPTGEIEIPREPELQETADETTRATVADHVEPGLLSTLESVPETIRKAVAQEHFLAGDGSNVGAEEPSLAATMHVAPAQSDQSPLPAIRATGEVSDADFEARVAAAMAAYSQTTTPDEAQENSSVVPAEVSQPQPIYAAQAAETAPLEEAVQSFEYHPPVRTPEPVESPVAITESAAEAASANSVSVSSISSNATPSANAHQAASSDVHEVVTASVEAAAVAAATETGADHHNIAQAVHRVMERLKPELVEEIMRELRSRK